ncbi:unnamed protein product [Cylicostephanus goldi]|uniref:Uncharacterized protein n=1 Tax=Cylicostephanus goldi TaxID=71465 RepID=A0A3P7M6H6_CYLGO|nr:unnamed protein product [Cylicostephanus goldi]
MFDRSFEDMAFKKGLSAEKRCVQLACDTTHEHLQDDLDRDSDHIDVPIKRKRITASVLLEEQYRLCQRQEAGVRDLIGNANIEESVQSVEEKYDTSSLLPAASECSHMNECLPGNPHSMYMKRALTSTTAIVLIS